MAGTHRSQGAFKALIAAITVRRRPGDPSLVDQLAALPRLVTATVRGTYPGLTKGRLGLVALGLVYVVSPVDLVPEAVFLVAGLADDAVVLAWLAGTVLDETNAFLRWEAGPAEQRPWWRRGARGGHDTGRTGAGETVEGHVVG